MSSMQSFKESLLQKKPYLMNRKIKSHSQGSRKISKEVLTVANLLPNYPAATEIVVVLASCIFMTSRDLQQYALDLEFGTVSGAKF